MYFWFGLNWPSYGYVVPQNMLYYLCATRPMRIRDIQEYMKQDGYDTGHSSIIQGIKCMYERIEGDKDYLSIVKKIEGCVI